MAKSVASSLVCSRLDYANSLLYGTTQKYQSATVRPKYACQCRCRSRSPTTHTHTSGILKHLHWLQTCHADPQYPLLHSACLLNSLLNYHTPTRSLRSQSANASLLSVPRVRTTFASRGFSVAAPAIWNSLPSDICDSSSTHTFRRLLKTHCFQQAFGSP